MAEYITGKIEGTRFAHDVQVYDPETGEITASLAMSGSLVPVADVVDIANPSGATAEDVANKVNELLAALRDAGVLE